MDLVHALPFVAMLLGIALLPIVVPHFWEHPTGPIILVVACTIPAIVDAAVAGQMNEILDGLGEYVAFIALIAALYVTAGGIYISGADYRVSPCRWYVTGFHTDVVRNVIGIRRTIDQHRAD